MAVPKKRKSHSRARTQRNHDALAAKPWINCPQCREVMAPHRICACGHYRSRQIFERSEG